MDNQYEWASHEPSGLKAGVDPNIIDVIKYNKPAVGLGEKETVIIAFGRELFAQRKVSPATFAVALRFFGPGGTADLASLMSQYAATSALVMPLTCSYPKVETVFFLLDRMSVTSNNVDLMGNLSVMTRQSY